MPLLAELCERLLTWKEQLLPRYPVAEGIQYALSRWNELTVFSTDGAIPIDNNVSEREMKRIILNKKGLLFVGNPRGGGPRRSWRASLVPAEGTRSIHSSISRSCS